MKYHFASGSVILFLLLGLVSQRIAYADEITLQQVHSGSLLSATDRAGYYLPLPTLATEVDIAVSGLLTRTNLRQTFLNESNQWIEAVYVFPLPDTASVDALEMIAGERTIKGIIQTRKQATQTYQTAKRSGKRATLVEQQRANLFTSRIANIAPNETISVSISYQSRLRYDDGSFSLRFPLTITPRYQPGRRLQNSRLNDDQTLTPATSGWVSSEISPPMVDSATAANTIINVEIEAGVPLARIESGSHSIHTAQDNDRWVVSLTDHQIPMDRDFELTWHPVTGNSPLAAVFRKDRVDQNHSDSFASLMLVPPQNLFDTPISSREVIFVIDTSGSMQGNSIIQARNALILGIDRLTARDTFNVIEFDDNTLSLFRSSRPADDNHRDQARQWVQALYADGGTEIAAAMDAALIDKSSTETPLENSVRQIVFITDGSVGNEDEIFHRIEQNINHSRLFTVGIGSAPNTWFMRKAAEIGRGSYTFIAHDNEVSEKMMALFHKIERPVLLDVSLTWEGVKNPEIYPATVPDLYAGEPVLADARWDQPIDGGALIISGMHAGNSWSQRLQLASKKQSNDSDASEQQSADNGLDKRWAHRKIEALEEGLLFGADNDTVKQQVTATALDYGLITRYTSLVAVEDKVVRDPIEKIVANVEVPSAMPAGNTMSFPQGSIGITFRLMLSVLFSILAILFSLATLKQTRSL